jgi:ABC-type proline/glycine betaine transport system permease subunit
MTLIRIFNPPVMFLGINLFYWITIPAIVLFIKYVLLPLVRESIEGLRKAWEDDNQDFTYDIKHVHLN